jgi:hypothetical protein
LDKYGIHIQAMGTDTKETPKTEGQALLDAAKASKEVGPQAVAPEEALPAIEPESSVDSAKQRMPASEPAASELPAPTE